MKKLSLICFAKAEQRIRVYALCTAYRGATDSHLRPIHLFTAAPHTSVLGCMRLIVFSLAKRQSPSVVHAYKITIFGSLQGTEKGLCVMIARK